LQEFKVPKMIKFFGTYLLRHGSGLQNEVFFFTQNSQFPDPEIKYFSEFNYKSQ